MHKSGTLKGSLGLLRSSELFHWTVMQGKHSQKLCYSTETHWTLPTSIFFDVWEYTALITVTLKIPVFILFLESHAISSYIGLIKLLLKLCSIFGVYLSLFLTALASILAYFVSYLLTFCHWHSIIFAMAPSLASSHFKHILYIALMFPSLTGQHRCTCLDSFQ